MDRVKPATGVHTGLGCALSCKWVFWCDSSKIAELALVTVLEFSILCWTEMRDPLSSPVPKIFLYLKFFHIYLCIHVKVLNALTYTYIYIWGSEDNLGETVHSYSVGSQELDSGCQDGGKHFCWLSHLAGFTLSF